MKLKLLVIGSGGREHAIAKKLKDSSQVLKVYCAPGNPGMELDGIFTVDIAENNHAQLIQFAQENQISWTFVGPEVPLLNGIVDDFQQAGLKIFGPQKKAALIEGSKEFAKEIMFKYQIPTAGYQAFSDYDTAIAYLERQKLPIVIKADGLAAGKGVVVAEDIKTATVALKEMLLNKQFGESSARVVIEDFLEGEEFSLLAFVKGDKVYPMVVAQDHKRAYEGDRGPNTGGMGAYAPVPHISEDVVETALQQVVIPCARGLKAEGRSFTGILYAGLIATETGPKVIEFNARFGDPETQVVLPRLESDFAAVISDLLEDKEPEIIWRRKGYNLGVVVAADGYPGDYKQEIPLPDILSHSKKDIEIIYAGVTETNGKLVSKGGRIYLVQAYGETLSAAQQVIYEFLTAIPTTGTFYRSDIGSKALTYERKQ